MDNPASSEPSPIEKSKQLVETSRELLAKLTAVLEKKHPPGLAADLPEKTPTE